MKDGSTHYDVVVIGGGWAGIGVSYALKEAGLSHPRIRNLHNLSKGPAIHIGRALTSHGANATNQLRNRSGSSLTRVTTLKAS